MPDTHEGSDVTLVTESDYLNRVAMHADTFSATERRIAEAIAGQYGQGISASITDFAQQAGVSVSSVVRFCKLLGYRGFGELKFHIRQESFRVAADDLSIHGQDDIDTVKKKTAQFARMSIDRTMQILDDEQVQRAVEAIRKAKNVYFCGAGSASGVARLAANQFMVMGVRAFAQSDLLLNLRSASYLGPEEVMVAISYDGYAKGGADAIMLAKEAGATTILISCVADSLSHQYADIVLQTAARNNANVLNIVTLTMCQLAVIQTLMIGVWLQDEERFSLEAGRQKSIAEMVRYEKQQKTVQKRRINS